MPQIRVPVKVKRGHPIPSAVSPLCSSMNVEIVGGALRGKPRGELKSPGHAFGILGLS